MASNADNRVTVNRRSLLRSAAAAGAAAALASRLTEDTQAQGAPAAAPNANAQLSTLVVSRPGSDFMVDVMKSLGVDYLASNPGSSFRSLQESIVNYGGNKQPEFITCMHEESSVALAHGYAKAAGKPMMILAHSTVGLQHAAMGVYNAWSDRVPIILMAGNIMDATHRRAGVEWYHSAQDPAALLRDMTKWDDQPMSLQAFAESLVRGYRISTTPPMEPVLIIADGGLQEGQVDDQATPGSWHPTAPALNSASLSIPKLIPPIPPVGDTNALADAAKMLANAQNPLILADRAVRTPDGVALMVKLAEALGAPVVDVGGRMNMPNTHFANLSGMKGQLVKNADVILALEMSDIWGQLNDVGDPFHDYRRLASPDVKVIHINLGDMYMKSNYQDFERFQPVDMPISGDVEASLPTLINALQDQMGTRQDLVGSRTDKLKSMFQTLRKQTMTNASYGWDASPITTARLAAETWNVVKNENWSLCDGGLNGWANRMFPISDYHHTFGGSGGGGVGYSSPAAVGVALANKDQGRITINFQADGDMMYAPGVLWTAAHHKIPLLRIMFNNRGYHQEMMHLQRMASVHGRSPDTAPIGTAITDPDIDYAKLAASMGWWSAGPISDPSQLNSALTQALEVVKSGAPALVDVVCQPR